MGQLVEPGRALPDDPALLWFDIGALSHRLPEEIAPERLEDTALQCSAPLARSVRQDRPDARSRRPVAKFRSYDPLMCDETAHE